MNTCFGFSGLGDHEKQEPLCWPGTQADVTGCQEYWELRGVLGQRPHNGGGGARPCVRTSDTSARHSAPKRRVDPAELEPRVGKRNAPKKDAGQVSKKNGSEKNSVSADQKKHVRWRSKQGAKQGAKKGAKKEPKRAKKSQKEPKRAKKSQKEPKRAKKSQNEPKAKKEPKKSQKGAKEKSVDVRCAWEWAQIVDTQKGGE